MEITSDTGDIIEVLFCCTVEKRSNGKQRFTGGDLDGRKTRDHTERTDTGSSTVGMVVVLQTSRVGTRGSVSTVCLKTEDTMVVSTSTKDNLLGPFRL